uniref:Pseudo vic protein n=1 Tax=Cryphonectria parasitica TaxID=5116 RepID=W1I7I9_CRYPA|nr:pseudo vic [Cryphonectria parasitica]
MASEDLKHHPRQCEQESELGLQENRSLCAQDNLEILATPLCDTGFQTTTNRPCTMFAYRPLPDGCIRLLRLMPHREKHAPIQCQLFDYHLLDSWRATHLYEALSYVWGSPNKCRSIFTDDGDLRVTENLHAALSWLRDRSLPRVIWVDAICINQSDTEERNRQVQLMAKIYAKANRVIVWLEEATPGHGQAAGQATTDSDQALKSIEIAAEERSTSSNREANQQAVQKLLQQGWFRRIWVLQEVAAARHIVIACHSMEIDGYAFCEGLKALNNTCGDLDLLSRTRSAIYLIKGAGLRSKYATSRSNRFSLYIRPLGELLDMYHNREATERLDKVYALLGMSSDDDIPADLLPDYNIQWKDLFHRLVKFLVGTQASVETWKDEEIAVIRCKGSILGEVSRVESGGAWIDSQDVSIAFKNASGHLGQEMKRSSHWTLHPTAKSIREGDLVCLLQDASKPAIIRLHEDYCTIIAISVTLTDDERWREPPLLMKIHDFLLVWDWKKFQNMPGDEEDYDRFMNSRLPEHAKVELKSYPGRITRLGNQGLILADKGKFDEASWNLRKAISTHQSPPGRELPHTLMAAETILSEYKDRDDTEWFKLRKMANLLGRRGSDTHITERKTIRLTGAFDQEVIALLLHQRSDEVKITAEVVQAAAGNLKSSREVMALLLDQRSDEVKITAEVVQAAAGNERSGREVMALLLDQRSDEVKITAEVVQAAAGNEGSGREVIALLLDQRSDEVKITAEVVQAAAGNWRSSREVMALLLDQRSDEVKITAEVVQAAAGNGGSGEEVMALLLDQHRDRSEITSRLVELLAASFDEHAMEKLLIHYGDEVKITAEVVQAAAGNWRSSREVMALLLDQRSDEVKITAEVVQAAAGNEGSGREVMALLLDQRSDEVKITAEVVQAAAGNEGSGREVMALLLDQRSDEVKITAEVVQAAAGNWRSSREVMALLLDQRSDEVKITAEVVQAAAGNWRSGREVMALLLDQRSDEVKITAEVVQAAAGNWRSSREVMALLLDQRSDEVKITAEVVQAAAGNWRSGREVMALLLDQRSDEVKITAEVVQAAAGNWRSGREVMALLLDQRSDEVKITAEVVQAAAGNWGSGREVMALLLDQRSDEVKITAEVVQAAAGNEGSSREVMALLLDQRSDEVKITAEVVQAAAGNEGSGREVMALLLDQRSDEVKITAEVVQAAAGNEGSGREVMALLQD